MNHEQLVAKTKAYNLGSWAAQAAWQPISIARGQGAIFWDADGRRYLDWSSQAFNVNIGHGHPHVIEAIQRQAATLCSASPGLAHEPRARLGELLAEITPPHMRKSFFTLGGAEAVENALKIARLYTGRQKILSRYRAYHGATFAAMSAGGDPRRLANEPGVPWIVHIHDPYAYRSPLYRGRTPEEGDQALVDQIAETIEFEGPDQIAGILLEGYSGANGAIQGGETFWRGVQTLCHRYGILLIVDEVLSGFGRTGRWFGIDHYPGLRPDILALAKGLTSGYAPLGAVVVSDAIATFFEDHTLWAGLTLHAHPLSCAAAIATIEVYRQEGLIERAALMGEALAAGLADLARRHACVGEARGVGLHHVLELVRDRETREPLSPFHRPLSPAMAAIAAALRGAGLYTVVRWNYLFSAPPLVITESQLAEGLDILDRVLGGG